MPTLSKNHRRDPILVNLGAVLREIRLERGLSQESLALLAEVDRSYLGQVERADNNVTVLALVKIVSALEVSLAELMRRAGL